MGTSPTLRIVNFAGEIRIVGWSKPVMDVEATKYARNAQELTNTSIVVRRERVAYAVFTQYSGARQGGGVRYRISLPAQASLIVESVAGTVDITGVNGNLDVQSQAGAITVDAGRVAGSRSINLRAVSGLVKLSVAGSSNARVEAESTVGDFSSDVPGISQQRNNVVGAHGEGTIGSGSARIRLMTATGAIKLLESNQ